MSEPTSENETEEAAENEAADAATEDEVIGGEAGGEDDTIGSANDEEPAGDVQSPEYENLVASAPVSGAHPSLDIVLDVPVTMSLEVGKASMTVGELIRLGEGAVVELDRAVGEPLDVMVNGALVAHGEIVLVNEKFGIRLTSVVQPEAVRHKEAS